MSKHPTHVSSRELARLEAKLSPRDIEIVQFVARHRFAATAQIRRLLFHSHATQGAATRATIRVLDRLLILRILGRLERTIGGQARGSSGYVWHIDVVGERLTRPEDARMVRRHLFDPSLAFLAHALATADAHVQIAEAARSGAFDIGSLEVEREAWRRIDGGRSLKPDAMVSLLTSEFEDHWYLEIDRATESLQAVLRKCRLYEDYRLTGRAQAEHGVFPRVLWLVPTERRRGALTAAFAAEGFRPGLFEVQLHDQLVRTLVADPDAELPTTAEASTGGASGAQP